MALCDLSEPDSLEFVKFLVGRGANVKLVDVNGDSCLHRLARMKFSKPQNSHTLSAETLNAIRDRQKRILLEVVKFLIDSGAPLDAKN